MTGEQKQMLGEMLPGGAVKQRKQGGGQVSYIEGHHAIREANRIFGFDGWQRFTDSMNMVQSEQGQDGRWKVAYVAKVRVVVDGVTREGYGFGNGLNPDLGAAHELAAKEAETDGMKRAMMTFGDPFGLALYDKSQANVDRTPRPTPPPPIDPRASDGEKERSAGLYLSRQIGITPKSEPFGKFKTACGDVPWREVALEAEQAGVVDFNELMRYVLEGVKPEREYE